MHIYLITSNSVYLCFFLEYNLVSMWGIISSLQVPSAHIFFSCLLNNVNTSWFSSSMVCKQGCFWFFSLAGQNYEKLCVYIKLEIKEKILCSY